MASSVRIADGSFSFDGGVDSGRVTTVQSDKVPHGLARNQLAWLDNGTVRSGGIRPRNGWQFRGTVAKAPALYQGGFMYEPNFANPNLILQISGQVMQVNIDTAFSVTDLSAQFGLFNPPAVPRAYFTQGNEFLVIQAGDNTQANPTLPLFWDGTTLRRSNGIQSAPPLVTYNVTTTSPFTIQAATGNQVLHLAAPYPGQLFDKVVMENAGLTDLGSFIVAAISGNQITLTTIATTHAALVVAPQPLTLTVESPATASMTTTGPWIVPIVGSSVTLALTTGYPGNTGDEIQITDASSNIVGTFKVLAQSASGVTIQTVASTLIGDSIPAQALALAIETPTVTDELPAATVMVFYQGRIWYAQGRQYIAGDITGDQASGTLAYNFRDSVLKVTENPLATGGDGFSVPSNAGDITALSYTANLDSSLGQGPLYIFTRRQVYALTVPVSRNAWIAANNNNQPVQTVAQINYGATSDTCVVHVNGDLFYQSLEPAIRSLFVSTRFFTQWANPPISRAENRVLQFNDRSLMNFASGITFDDRLWQTILPYQTPAGVAFKAIAPLDFDPIDNFGSESDQVPPAWEGMLEGLDILQLFEGDFGGLQRAFAVVHNLTDDSIEVWELTDYLLADQGPTQENRIAWYFETPAYDFGRLLDLKQLDGLEMWLDSISGKVDITVEYRPDADPCWQLWSKTSFCAARNQNELPGATPSNYPVPSFCQGQKFPLTFPVPPANKCETMNARICNRGYQFQLRVTIKGWCRVRGLLLFGLPVERAPFENVNC